MYFCNSMEQERSRNSFCPCWSVGLLLSWSDGSCTSMQDSSCLPAQPRRRATQRIPASPLTRSAQALLGMQRNQALSFLCICCLTHCCNAAVAAVGRRGAQPLVHHLMSARLLLRLILFLVSLRQRSFRSYASSILSLSTGASNIYERHHLRRNCISRPQCCTGGGLTIAVLLQWFVRAAAYPCLSSNPIGCNAVSSLVVQGYSGCAGLYTWNASLGVFQGIAPQGSLGILEMSSWGANYGCRGPGWGCTSGIYGEGTLTCIDPSPPPSPPPPSPPPHPPGKAPLPPPPSPPPPSPGPPQTCMQCNGNDNACGASQQGFLCEGSGDCDTDEDCVGGTVCGSDNCRDFRSNVGWLNVSNAGMHSLRSSSLGFWARHSLHSCRIHRYSSTRALLVLLLSAC